MQRGIQQGSEQEQRDRAAGVKALFSMLATTTSGRAKEFVKQSLNARNGMMAFGGARERFGKTAGVAKLTGVFQFQRTSGDSLEDQWLKWVKLMRRNVCDRTVLVQFDHRSPHETTGHRLGLMRVHFRTPPT